MRSGDENMACLLETSDQMADWIASYRFSGVYGIIVPQGSVFPPCSRRVNMTGESLR